MLVERSSNRSRIVVVTIPLQLSLFNELICGQYPCGRNFEVNLLRQFGLIFLTDMRTHIHTFVSKHYLSRPPSVAWQVIKSVRYEL